MSYGKQDSSRGRLGLNALLGLGLVLLVLAVYLQVVQFDFTNYDDPGYVSQNPQVQAGLTAAGIRSAFTARVVGNWMPATLLSHTLDWELFGANAGLHHLTSVVLHALAAVLLFLTLRRSGIALIPSAFIAAVFALHPLHVQPVAWVADRKDVLSAVFFFLALYLYVLYTERPSAPRYMSVIAAYSLGLMSKPMLVTLPLVLLLVDFWPLRRPLTRRTLLEKLPLLALAAASSVVTYFVQRSAGALQPLAFSLRVENALVSYLVYIRQTFWPAHLAVFYPLPEAIPLWQAALAFIVLLAVSLQAIRTRATHPYFATGWFWYLVMLLPVIGFVQVGAQAHADRYAYLPMVGLLMALAAGAEKISDRLPVALSLAVPAVLVVLCCLRSFQEVAHWRNTETLFEHALDVTSNNWIAEGNLGAYLMTQPERRGDAVDHLNAALRIHPDEPEANNNLGLTLAQAGLCREAILHFQTALRTRPGFPKALNNLATCYMTSGRYADALPYLQAALQSDPQSPDIHFNLGMTLANIPSREQEAASQYQAALRINPNLYQVHYAFGILLAKQGRNAEAIAQFEAASLIQPDPRIGPIIEKLRAR